MRKADPIYGAGTVETGGWANSQVLQAGNPDVNFSMQALFDTARVRTVAFSSTFPASPLAVLQAEAEINWSVNGQTISRKLTIRSGLSLTGNCEGVRVFIRDVSNIVLGGKGTPYEVICTLADGGRPGTLLPSTFQPPQNGGVGLLAGNASIILPIPQNIGAIAVNVQIGNDIGAAQPDMALDVAQMGAGALGVFSQYDPRNYIWAPLHPAAVNLRIRNNTNNPTYYSVLYAIDG